MYTGRSSDHQRPAHASRMETSRLSRHGPARQNDLATPAEESLTFLMRASTRRRVASGWEESIVGRETDGFKKRRPGGHRALRLWAAARRTGPSGGWGGGGGVIASPNDDRIQTGRPQFVSRLAEPTHLGMPDGGPWGSDTQWSHICHHLHSARPTTVGRPAIVARAATVVGVGSWPGSYMSGARQREAKQPPFLLTFPSWPRLPEHRVRVRL